MTVLHDAGLGLLVPTLSVRDNPFFFQKGEYKFLYSSHKERTIQPFWVDVTFFQQHVFVCCLYKDYSGPGSLTWSTD
jgi:hypothetical protein